MNVRFRHAGLDPAFPVLIKDRRFHYMGIATLGALRYRCVFWKWAYRVRDAPLFGQP